MKTVTTLPPAQLTKRDWTEIAEILNGTRGERDGIEYWFDGPILRLQWIRNYRPATLHRPDNWQTICQEWQLDGIAIDEDQALWDLELHREEGDPDALLSLEEMFVTEVIK